MYHRDFPGGPVFKALPSNAGGVGLIPDQGAKIPHALRPKHQNIKHCYSNIVTNSIKTLKMVHIKKKNLEKKPYHHYQHVFKILLILIPGTKKSYLLT